METNFWLTSLNEFNFQPIWHNPSAVRVVYSDASDIEYGRYTVKHGPYIAHGQWKLEEARLHSTWRELRAVCLVLEFIAAEVMYARVRWFMDNIYVLGILHVASMKHDLQQEVIKVFNLTIQHQSDLEPNWIPHEKNQYAKYLSHIVDGDD